MAVDETKSRDEKVALRVVEPAAPRSQMVRGRRLRVVPYIITLATVSIAAALGWAMWNSYMGTPWTRDGTVRTYVVTMAPEVAGRIVELPVTDNQFVHKGDLLIVIDPTDYRIALELAEATVKQTEATAQNARIEAER